MKYDEIDNDILFTEDQIEKFRRSLELGFWPHDKTIAQDVVRYLIGEVFILKEKVELLESVAYLTDGKSTLKIVNLAATSGDDV